MDWQKKCKHCGKILKRRRNGKKLESLRDFKRRNFCNRSCSGKFHKSAGSKQDIVEIFREAAEQAVTPGKYKTGVEILRELANNSRDETTKLNAAKALAAYETPKATSRSGVKHERGEKAKKAASGKFSAGAPPMARVK